jgi:hypothetical protein
LEQAKRSKFAVLDPERSIGDDWFAVLAAAMPRTLRLLDILAGPANRVRTPGLGIRSAVVQPVVTPLMRRVKAKCESIDSSTDLRRSIISHPRKRMAKCGDAGRDA